MDYEVFVLARMRESYDRRGDTRGRHREHRPHGPAGHQFGADPGPVVPGYVDRAADRRQILATGLGAGILIDATLIRCFLVPAFVRLSGAYNWWLPAWAARVLHIEPSQLHPARLLRTRSRARAEPA